MKAFMLNPMARAVKLAIVYRADELRLRRRLVFCCSACYFQSQAIR